MRKFVRFGFGSFVSIIAVFAAVIMVSCAKKSAEQQAADDAPPETVYAVNSFITQTGTLDAYLEFGGDVEASSSVDILPDTAGRITAIYVKPGTRVSSGQTIAAIDASRPGLNYAPNPVRAPISGTITSVPYSIGTTVSPSMSIGKVSSANNLEITIQVAERFVSRIRLGQRATLLFDAYPAEHFNATVVEVSPVLNVASRSMEVKLHLVTVDPRVKIGMYARVKLVTDEKENAIVVPYTALVRRQGGAYVFAIEKNTNTVTMLPIQEGIRVDDRIEILSGLSGGQEIVVKGQTLLNDGSKVNIVSTVNDTDGNGAVDTATTADTAGSDAAAADNGAQ
ncbi:MAG: efflux RND transporter periplasmic adaptor subunit [Treponemataceae bacterium]|nr:MAG: efflux RND transporter periplasmic adaptor subunit [Treponemataceae bacterium]